MLIADSCEDPEAVIQLKHRLETLMAKALENILNKKGSHKDSTQLEILPDLCKVIGRLGEESDTDIEDIIYFLLDSYQYNNIPIAYDEIDVDQVVYIQFFLLLDVVIILFIITLSTSLL